MNFANVTTADCLLPGSNTDNPCDDEFTLPQCEDPLYAYQHQSECPDWSDISDLVVRPSDGEVEVGKGYQFRAFLTFENGDEKDVTELATWSTGNSSVATVDDDDEKGTVTGVAIGVTTVIATYLSRIGLGEVEVVAACETTGVDFVLVFDRSGSMNDVGADGKTRMAKTVEAARNLVLAADFTVDQMAVVSFAGGISGSTVTTLEEFGISTLHQGLTNDRDLILAAIAQVDPVTWDHCDTPTAFVCATGIGAGLETAYDELASDRHNEGSRKTVVLLTDGMENICDPDPVVIAEQMRAEYIAIAVIALAIPAGVYGDCDGAAVVASEYLEGMTSCDLYFEADTADELPNIYARIPRLVCQAIADEDPCIYYGS